MARSTQMPPPRVARLVLVTKAAALIVQHTNLGLQFGSYLIEMGTRERGGVVRVVTKPKQGKLSRERVIAPMQHQGRSSDTHCNGVTIPGFRIQYTSDPGFRGIDQFILERTLPNGRVDVDTFTIVVR
jgi:hypothetical protein